MRRARDTVAADPIVAAAMAARGIDPNDLPEGVADDPDEFEVNATRDLPAIHLWDNGEATVSWHHPDHMVRYALDAEGGIVTIVGYVLPDTVLEGLAGRRLSDAFSFPGAERMRILAGVNTSAFTGDPTDVRMTVEPIGRDAA